MSGGKSVGWGKIILLGEHAVVYGYPALAAALDRGVTMAAVPTPAGGPMRLDVPVWDLATTAGSLDDHHPVGRALAAVADALAIGRPSVSLIGDAQIPMGAGLGSSAAMAVAVTRALLAWAKRRPDRATIATAASASETLLHGRASGVDVALAMSGGIGVFRKGAGLHKLALAEPLRIIVGTTQEPRHTAAMIDRVATATGATRDDARLRELGGLTDTGTAALAARDLAGLGAAMNRAHAVLAELGVSTPTLDALCATARREGAHGAKLTGAGGGGALIALAPRDREAAIVAARRAAGTYPFITTIARSSASAG